MAKDTETTPQEKRQEETNEETKEEKIRSHLPEMLKTVLNNSKNTANAASLNPDGRRFIVPSLGVNLFKLDRVDWDRFAFVQTDVLRGDSIVLVVSEKAFLFAQFAVDATREEVREKLATIRDKYMTGFANERTTFDNWFFAPFVRIYVFLAVADTRPSSSGVSPAADDHTSVDVDHKHFIQPDHVSMITSEVDSWRSSRCFLPYILPADDPQANAYVRVRPVKDNPDRVWQWPEVTVVSSSPAGKDGAPWVTDFTADSMRYPRHLDLPYIDFVPGAGSRRSSE